MSEVVKFNVGGIRYEVSRSLLGMYPETMLAKCASERWQQDSSAEIFIERDGTRFRYCLDYMRDQGEVVLPVSVPREAVLKDLEYYGLLGDGGDGGVSRPRTRIRRSSADCVLALDALMEDIETSERRTNCLKFARECFRRVASDLTGGWCRANGRGRGGLEVMFLYESEGDWREKEAFEVARKAWHDIQEAGMRDHCNECLGKVGLELVRLDHPRANRVEVTLKVPDS